MRASSPGRPTRSTMSRVSIATCAALLSCAVAGAQDRARETVADAIVSGTGGAAAFTQRADRAPEVAEEYRRQLGGIAINGRNNAPWRAPDIDGITVARLDAAEPSEFQILAPFGTTLGWLRFSPDGAWLSYVVVRDTGVEQWVAEIARGIPRPLTSASLNAAWGEPCQWLADSSGMLCRFLVSGRGSPPEACGCALRVLLHEPARLRPPGHRTAQRSGRTRPVRARGACAEQRPAARRQARGIVRRRTPPRTRSAARLSSWTRTATWCAGWPTCRPAATCRADAARSSRMD